MVNNNNSEWINAAVVQGKMPEAPTGRLHYYNDAVISTDDIEIRAERSENKPLELAKNANQLGLDAPYYEVTLSVERLRRLMDDSTAIVLRVRNDPTTAAELFFITRDNGEATQNRYALLKPMILGYVDFWRPQVIEVIEKMPFDQWLAAHVEHSAGASCNVREVYEHYISWLAQRERYDHGVSLAEFETLMMNRGFVRDKKRNENSGRAYYVFCDVSLIAND
jgi:hypothetical protein